MRTPQIFRKVRWVRVGVAVAVLFGVMVGVAWWRSRVRPSWWQEMVPNEVVGQLAERMENVVVTQLTQARPAAADADVVNYRSPEWTVSIKDADADAWLCTRLKGWLENRNMKWPPGLADVQVDVREGAVVVGVHLVQKGSDRVISAALAPEVRKDGSIWVSLRGMSLGGLPLPSGIVLGEMRDAAKGTASEQWLDMLEGKKPLSPDSVFKLEDGRAVRVMKIAVRKGMVEITCRTEKR